LYRISYRPHEGWVPESTLAIADLSPSWASETTKLTPFKPRLTKERRKRVHKASSSYTVSNRTSAADRA
jgi:hypothetical protein